MFSFTKNLLRFFKWCIFSAFYSMLPKQHFLSGHRQLVKYLNDYCRKCEEDPEFTSGLILMSLGGVGRDMICAVPERGENEEVQVAPFRDWLTLTEDPGLNGRRYWRFCQHDALARQNNIHLVNS